MKAASIVILVSLAWPAWADVYDPRPDPLFIEHDGYSGRASFSSGLYQNYPVDRLESTSFNRKDLVLFVEWSGLEDRLYLKVLRAYDPYGALVNEWYYQFSPENGEWRTWDQFEMGQCITNPGTWRFEILMDGEVVLDTTFEIESAEDAREFTDVDEVEEIGIVEVQ